MIKVYFLICLFVGLNTLTVGDATADKIDIEQWNTLFNTDYTGEIYSGYLSADDAGTTQFFYQFYPAIDSPTEKPVILYLEGGPGCSSIFSAFSETGPFLFQEYSTELIVNENSWTSFANLLYIESPITVGFSYGPDGVQSDKTTSIYNLNALVQFFVRFPEYQTNKFFIAGISYAGIYIPTLADKIINYNAAPTNQNVQKINLQGIAIGNGCTDPTECTPEADKFLVHIFGFYGRHGLISDTLYQQFLGLSETCYGSDSAECQDLVTKINTQVYGTEDSNILFNPYNVYQNCYEYTPEGSKRGKMPKRGKFEDDTDIPPCVDVTGVYHWFRQDSVRNLFHVSANSPQWQFCSTKFNINTYTIDPLGSYYLYPEIIKNNIRVLIFSGDVDSVVPITGTLYWINKLQEELYLNIIKPWRPWYVNPTREEDPNQIAGNVVDLEGLTFISVRNSGHDVPGEKKVEASSFMQTFLRGDYLP